MVKSTIQAADEFNAAAGGRYKIEVFPGGVLGGMLEVFDMVQAGAIDMCDFAPDYLSEKDLLFGAQGLAFAFKDGITFQKYLNNVRKAMWDKRLTDTYKVKLMSLTLTFPHDAWCGTKPIHTLEDWKGKVVWVGGPAEAEAITALGASPVTMDWGDGYPSIEKGVVDGGTYGLGAAWMLKWTACKYYTDARMFLSSGGIIINNATFNSLPKDIQDLMVNVFQKHQDRMIQFFTYDAPKMAETDLVAGGAEVYHVPADEVARWKEKTKPIWDSFFSKLKPEDAKLIQDLIAEANK